MTKETIRQALAQYEQRELQRITKFVEELHAEYFGTIEKG